MTELEKLLTDMEQSYRDVEDSDSFDYLHDFPMLKTAVKKLLDRVRYADALIREIKATSPKSHTIAIDRYERSGRDDDDNG